MTPDQLKEARALLGWSRDRVAGASNVPSQAVGIFENGVVGPSMTPERVALLRAVLEAGGTTFINGEVPGVQLRRAPDLTRDQVQAARALLGWTRPRLARASGIPEAALVDFERGAVSKAMRPERLAAVRAALELAGIEFTNGDNPGVNRRRACRG